MATLANTPLSGSVDSFAPTHPTDPSDMDAKPLKAPKGEAPLPSNPPLNQEPAPAPENEAPPPDAVMGSFPDAEAAEAGDEENPFIDKPQADAVPEELNPFDEPAPAPLMPAKTNPMVRGVVGTNLAAHEAMKPAQPSVDVIKSEDPVSDFIHGIEAGLQVSTTGLGIRGKMPDKILPEQADMAMRIGNQIGVLAGDLPAIAGGIIAGGLGGGMAGTTALPIIGTVSGSAVGAGAGAFAVPAALRKALIDHYEKGDITDRREFAARVMATSWEAVKGGITGAATTLTGGVVGPVAGKLAGAGAELVAMTTVGSALEGHLPTTQEFADGAVLLGGIKIVSHAVSRGGPPPPEGKLRDIYAKTGETPAEIIERAATDVELKQQLVAGNAQEPIQAAPSRLEHVEVKEPAVTEGAPEKVVGTKTELVPKTFEEMGLGDPPPFNELKGLAGEYEARAEVLSKIGISGERPKKAWAQKFEDFYARNVDYLDPLHSAIEEAKRQGAEIPEADNAYNLGRLAAAHMDRTRTFLEHGTRDAATGEVNGEGLNAILKDIPGGDMDGFRAYAMSERALELHGRDIQPWADFNPETARKVVDTYRPAFEAINERRIKFGERVLDWAAAKGLFSEGQVEAMKEANKYHIPFNRAFETNEMTGTVKSGAALKKIFGSEREIIDPILQTYKNVEMLIKRATVNEVRSTFVDNMAEGNMLGIGLKAGDAALSDVFLNKVKQPGMLRDNQIAVFKNGERQVFEGTPGVIDSLKRLDGDRTAMDITTKVLRGFSNMVRLGVVTNPAFGFAHFFRSQIMSSVYSKTGMVPFIHSALSLADFMQKPEIYKKWLYDGGATGSLFKLGETYLKDNKIFEADKKAPFIGKAWNAVHSVKDASESFIKLTDNLSRYTEYKRSVERGVDPIEAAMRSRDVVPDYAKVGLQRSVLRTGIAFIGAHINSIDRMFQEINTDPKGFAMKMSVITGMSAALWVVNKDDEAIEALPDHQQNHYWNINVTRFSEGYRGAQDATILRLPKPWAPGILFGSGAEVALNAYFKDNPREIHNFAHAVSKSVFPELMPNMLQPILDQYSNKQSFTGRPLVPEYKQKLLPELQYAPYTSETAKAIGKLIGYVPMVRDIGPSTDPLASPAVVENYIKTWGGTLGGWALKASDFAGRGFAWDSGKADPWENTPFLHQFVSRFPNFQDQRIQDFYENKESADKAYNSARAMARAGDFDAAERIRNAHPDFQIRLTGIAKGISTARRTYENVQDDPSTPAVEKRQILDTILFQIGSMAKEGNQMMSDFRRSSVQNSGKGTGY